MVFVLVDGDYLLTGFKTNSSEEVSHMIHHVEYELHRQLLCCNTSNGFREVITSPEQFENLIQLRVVLFSSALMNSLSEGQRQTLFSTFRRHRYQMSVLENSASRGGSPVDAALCTRAISFAMMPRFTSNNNNNNNGETTEKQTFCFVTPNAYISSALEFIISKHNCDALFIVYEGDDVTEELLPYISPFYGKNRDGIAKIKKSIEGGTLFIPNTEAASAALAALQQEGKDLPLSVLSELKKMQSSLAPRKTSGGGNKPTGDTADSVLNRLKQSEHAIILPPPLPGLPDPFAEETNNNDNNNKKEESVSSPNIFSDTPYLASTTDHPGVTAVPPKVSPPELLIDPSKLLTEVNGGRFDMDFITFMEEGNVLPNISTELPSQNWKVFYDETKNVKRLFYVYTDTKGEVRATWTHPGGSEKQREAEKSVLLWLNNYYNTQLKAKKTSVVSNTNSTTNNNAAEEALPAGWEERIDPRSGNKFYINHNTKETTWVCPQRQASLPASSSIRNSSISNNDVLPSGWEMRTDPQSNRPFYVNHVTKQTTWVKPTNTENNNNNNNTNSVTSNSSEWESRVDPRTGKTFYINHRTKQTSWEKPQGMSDNNNTAPAVSHPWEARVDPATGKTFYVNHETKQTSWTLPR